MHSFKLLNKGSTQGLHFCKVRKKMQPHEDSADATPKATEDSTPCSNHPDQQEPEMERIELSEEEAEALIVQQRQMFERVGDFEEQMRRVRVTNATRISDLNSTQFQAAGERSFMQQQAIVGACTEAMKAFALNKETFVRETALPVVEAMVVAINNDLMLDSDTESFFGVSVPDWDSVDAAFFGNPDTVTMFSQEIIQETIGLLVYRSWQIILRTTAGRLKLVAAGKADGGEGGAPSEVRDAELAAAAEDKCTEVPVADHESYTKITEILASALEERRMMELYCNVLNALPTTTDQGTSTLMEIERSMINNAINDKVLGWRLPALVTHHNSQ